MVDILHRVGITASRDDVYKALGTIDGLAAWWTEETTGDGDVDGVIQFRFPEVPGGGGCDVKVLESQPGTLVHWEIIDGPDEWIGTQVRFALSEEDEYTIVVFEHAGWREQNLFMHHCSTKWATFLMSLKQYVETGTGAPAPHDVKISNWH
jgi:uncharacterized protein YndB with AHSA1/START domain